MIIVVYSREWINLGNFYFVEPYQVTLFYGLIEMFHQEPSPNTTPQVVRDNHFFLILLVFFLSTKSL